MKGLRTVHVLVACTTLASCGPQLSPADGGGRAPSGSLEAPPGGGNGGGPDEQAGDERTDGGAGGEPSDGGGEGTFDSGSSTGSSSTGCTSTGCTSTGDDGGPDDAGGQEPLDGSSAADDGEGFSLQLDATMLTWGDTLAVSGTSAASDAVTFLVRNPGGGIASIGQVGTDAEGGYQATIATLPAAPNGTFTETGVYEVQATSAHFGTVVTTTFSLVD